MGLKDNGGANKVIDREGEICLYFAHSCSKMCILMNMLNIGLFHFHGQSPCFRAFYTTIAFQTYMPPINFLVEKVFIYLFSKFFFLPQFNNFINVFRDIIAPHLLLKKVATITYPWIFDHNIIRCNSTAGVI